MNRSLKKVAVTGGLSSGKTSVCRILEALGAYVVESDEVCHRLLQTSPHVIEAVLALLGPDVVGPQGLDRSEIANKVFNHFELLHSLESVLHPLIYEEIDRQYAQCVEDGTHLLFAVELPLLYETGMEGHFDRVLAVFAEREICERRYLTEHVDLKDYERRMQRQLAVEIKMKRADLVIVNNGSMEELRERTHDVFETLTKCK